MSEVRRGLTLPESTQELAQKMLNFFDDGSSNIILSPYSTFVSLIMTSSFFENASKIQILESLGIDTEIGTRDLLISLQNMIQTIEKEDESTSIIGVNSIWPNENLVRDMSIFEALIEVLGSKITPVIFPQPGLDQINQNISELTHGLIKGLVTPDAVNPSTYIIITSAIYFRSKWRLSFDPENTFTRSFELFDNSIKHTDFMKENGYLPYAEDSEAQVLSIPYVDDNSLIIFLPKRNDIESFKRLRTNFHEYINKLELSDIKIFYTIPKFTHKWGSTSLVEMLKSIGIIDIFEQSENSYIVTDILHKTFIEVNEEGTEASAATAVILEEEDLDEVDDLGFDFETIEFNADHPFIYLIRNKNGSVIFAGTYIAPDE
ncbi:serpin family protein [Histomonas meleagridis]|uniref:serpin family protein n=1 Tax=Histomonas meleagridis TaxID=135588 RepID=UPI0035595491|nr:serpin family protein [Histomonas meleagridis]KAH0799534.1 serpin family protein [Histomonas meleagridis]